MQGDAAVEYAIAKLFEDGELLRHLRRMRRLYARRRDALAAALVRRLGSVLTFRVPNGGMALWVRVADGVDIPRWEQAGRKLDVLFRGAGMLDFAGREPAVPPPRLHLPRRGGAGRGRPPDGPRPEAVSGRRLLRFRLASAMRARISLRTSAAGSGRSGSKWTALLVPS